MSAKAAPPIPADDAVLLMHFVDHVFPLQYPLYKATVPSGGRGWLLYRLLRSKAFYSAALALAAHHQQMVMAPGTPPYRPASSVQQESHLEVCIKLVNQSAQDACPKAGLNVVNAVIQLVFFEVCLPFAYLWQTEKTY